MKHTPRPWSTKPETDYVPAQVWAEGRQLAEVYGETRQIRAVNARLMASAPELLEALERICDAAESWHRETGHEDDDPIIKCDAICECIPQMKAAIRKARGD